MATEIRKPRASSLNDTRVLAEYLNDIAERTGGDTDLIDQALAEAAAAQEAAENAQTTANLAEANAQSAAVLGQQGIDDAADALAAAVAAQADANDVWVTTFIQDIDADGSASADGRMNIVSPVAGTITAIYTVINSAIINVTVITTSINGTPITGGAVTIGALSVKGDVDTATPSAANVVSVGSAIEVSSDGAAGATCKAQVLMKITRA